MQWKVDSGQHTLDSIQCTVDIGQYTVDSVQYTVNSGQYTVDSVQCAVQGSGLVQCDQVKQEEVPGLQVSQLV